MICAQELITSLCLKSVNDWSLYNYYLILPQTAKGVVVLFSFLPVINPHDILQKWIIKRRNWPTEIKVQQTNEER